MIRRMVNAVNHFMNCNTERGLATECAGVLGQGVAIGQGLAMGFYQEPHEKFRGKFCIVSTGLYTIYCSNS